MGCGRMCLHGVWSFVPTWGVVICAYMGCGHMCLHGVWSYVPTWGVVVCAHMGCGRIHVVSNMMLLQINTLHLCKPLVRAIEGSDIKDHFTKAQFVTYK